MTAARLLDACGLPAAWARRSRHVLFAIGADALEPAVDAWRRWRNDPERCERLHLVVAGIDDRAIDALARASGIDRELAAVLHDRWPSWTPDLHRLTFDAARVHWLLVPAAIPLAQVVATADTICWTGMRDAGDDAALKGLARTSARLMAAEGVLAAAAPSADTRAMLRAAGFRLSDDRADDIVVARRDPAVPFRRPARQPTRPSTERRAVIVGAGLAGCATAWALAEHGWRTVVLERNAGIAHEGSSQPAGVFHGIVHPRDGPHARFGRAGALAARHAAAVAIERHGVRGSVAGMLRVLDPHTDIAAARAALDALGLPPTHVAVRDAAEASARAGVRLERPAWEYTGGGWIDPGGLCAAFLAEAGDAVTVRTGIAVDALVRSGDAWDLRDASGTVVERAPVIVLANAGDAARLAAADWPLEQVRGQTALTRIADGAAAEVALPRLPVSGGGYAIPVDERTLAFGATARRGDMDPAWRQADHVENLERLEALLPDPALMAAVRAAPARGRVGWRCTSRDRLPLIGPMAALLAIDARADLPRLVPRRPGLFVHAALGSRGLTWCAIGAQVLAALVADAPVPVDARLLDAVDPARFLVRARRRAQRT